MGDKSPKSKQRAQNQKNANKQQAASNAKQKQDLSARAAPPVAVKGKK